MKMQRHSGMRILAFLVLCGSVVAWGPIYHNNIACSSIRGPSCLCDGTNNDLLTGSVSPDAFFFGSSAFIMSSTCPPEVAELHDPVFSGFLVTSAPKYTTPTFNATAFAQGYGSHVVADAVSFAFPDGYFKDTLVNEGVDWLYTWPLMLNADAYVFGNASCGKPSLPTAPLSAEGAQFLADATVAFRQSGLGSPAFPVVNASTVLACSASWQQHVNKVNALAAATPGPAAAILLQVLSPYAPTSPSDAANDVAMQARCGVLAVQAWLQSLGEGQAPATAAQNTLAAIATMYQSGICSPAPAM